jgi:maleylpyruvate isomerase
MIKLYSYFRSSAAYRVRIALNWKGLSYDYLPIHLLRNGGEQLAPDYRDVNPAGLVPAFIDDACAQGDPLQQSLAIIEYLEETHPTPSLLPKDPVDRAYVRGVAMQVSCDIHPLNNLRVLKYLKQTLQADDAQRDAWYQHWIADGFGSLEQRFTRDARTGQFVFGDTPTFADLCLVPQVFNARRMKTDLTPYPTLVRIADNAAALDAFRRAAPDCQPDSE